MPEPIPVDMSARGATPAPITDAEGTVLFRACTNLFRLWRLSDAEASVLLDLPPRTYARWKEGSIGRVGRDRKARLSNLVGIHNIKCSGTFSAIRRGPMNGYGSPMPHSAAVRRSKSFLTPTSPT